MAKKDKKAKKDKQPEPSDVVDRVRGAVERTFQATSGGAGPARDVGKSLLDEVAHAAQRIRESFDDLRVLEDVRGLRAEIEALSKRVAALEQQQQAAAAATTAAKPAAAKPAAAKPAARKPAGGRAGKPRATTSAPSKPTTTTTRRTTTRAKPASGS
jgi:cell division septum initiation protein DivIVA